MGYVIFHIFVLYCIVLYCLKLFTGGKKKKETLVIGMNKNASKTPFRTFFSFLFLSYRNTSEEGELYHTYCGEGQVVSSSNMKFGV